WHLAYACKKRLRQKSNHV
ncbi:ABC transporter family protein, partial [Vibrio parahaemolyticus V-223/04]